MQKTTYICNQCEKTIGDKTHISLMLNGASGIAHIDQSDLGQLAAEIHGKRCRWIVQRLSHNFIHFCNEKCLAGYFKTEMDKQDILKQGWIRLGN